MLCIATQWDRTKVVPYGCTVDTSIQYCISWITKATCTRGLRWHDDMPSSSRHCKDCRCTTLQLTLHGSDSSVRKHDHSLHRLPLNSSVQVYRYFTPNLTRGHCTLRAPAIRWHKKEVLQYLNKSLGRNMAGGGCYVR